MLDFFKKDSGNSKSFWKRPEGVTGFIFGAGILTGLGYLLYKGLPYIINILQNALHATFLFIGLAAVLYILFDPKFRNLLWFMYKSVMRAITSMFVKIDPIGILETYVEDLYKNLDEMNNHISKLKGQMQKMTMIIEKNEREMADSLKLAEAAKKAGNSDVVIINTRQYGRLEESNKRFKELYAKMEILYRVLSKMHKNSGFLIKDIENEVRIKKQEREAIRAGYSAMKRAMSIINGDPDKKMMFDQAMEAIVDDVSSKVGEMERFMEMSSTFIDSIDIQNGVYEQKGLELLEKMEKEGIGFIFDKTEKKNNQNFNIDDIKNLPEKEKSDNSENNNNENKYSDLF